MRASNQAAGRLLFVLEKATLRQCNRYATRIAEEKKLLSGKAAGVDSMTLDANAATKSIVCRDTGEDWKTYVVRLMKEEGGRRKGGIAQRRRDPALRGRKNKRVGNDEWRSKTYTLDWCVAPPSREALTTFAAALLIEQTASVTSTVDSRIVP